MQTIDWEQALLPLLTLALQFETYREVRTKSVARLERMPLADWWRIRWHEEFGEVSIQHQVRSITSHKFIRLPKYGWLCWRRGLQSRSNPDWIFRSISSIRWVRPGLCGTIFAHVIMVILALFLHCYAHNRQQISIPSPLFHSSAVKGQAKPFF